MNNDGNHGWEPPHVLKFDELLKDKKFIPPGQ